MISHWCYLFEVFLNLPEEVLVATVNSYNNSPISYHYADGVRKNGLHEMVLLFEKINALKREHKRSWSALRSSTTKPTCDELHTGAEKITAEISKLISYLKINEQETHKILAGIEAQVAQEKKEPDPHVAIDFSNTVYIDSSSITLLLNFQKRIQKVNGLLVGFGPNKDISDIFSIVHLDEYIDIYNSRAEFERELVNKG